MFKCSYNDNKNVCVRATIRMLMYHFVHVATTATMTIDTVSMNEPSSGQPPKQCHYQNDKYTQHTHTNQVEGNVRFYVCFDVHEKWVAGKIIGIFLWCSQVCADHDVWVFLQFGKGVAIVHTAITWFCCKVTKFITVG